MRALGARSRRFESSRPDQNPNIVYYADGFLLIPRVVALAMKGYELDRFVAA